MRNIIEGYGTRDLETEDTVLDQLSDEYGFDDAGRKLKLARDVVRLMIKNGTAATCPYEPGYKRDFALGFVLAAFNGCVSEVFARIKRESFGTLKRRIEDAFALTNHNAEVLRGTQITEEFLAARLKELKFALAVRTLAMRRQEEQREIRDRMREEEKARKEYDRAIKQAEREEALINKAIEEVQSRYESSSAEERAGYEAKLEQLEAERQAAEEKNRRAVSMAQQTRAAASTSSRTLVRSAKTSIRSACLADSSPRSACGARRRERAVPIRYARGHFLGGRPLP